MDIENIKEVRERSGSPLGNCKSALTDANGDIEQALRLLQERGTAKAIAKGKRIATEGRVHTYLHGEGRISVIVEVNCETDFVARNAMFLDFCDKVAMQIAAMSPQYVRRQDVPTETLAYQTKLFEAPLKEDGKPEKTWPKIIDGKLNKWLSEVCLAEQELVMDTDKNTVESARMNLIRTLGENIIVRRFSRWELGEGIDKKVSHVLPYGRHVGDGVYDVLKG